MNNRSIPNPVAFRSCSVLEFFLTLTPNKSIALSESYPYSTKLSVTF